MTPPDDEAAFLATYDGSRYPPVAVTVDVVLLTVRAGPAVRAPRRSATAIRSAGSGRCPAASSSPTTISTTRARRELQEETGVRSRAAAHAAELGHLEQLRSYGTPDRDPRMRVVSVAYVGFTRTTSAIVAGSDAADARFWTIDDLAIEGIGSPDGMPLAFDHARVVADGVERARAKLEYTTLATAFLDEPFTLGDLRRVYEAVWGEPLHEGNFRRKVLSTPGFVEPTGQYRAAPTGDRPRCTGAARATRLHPPILAAVTR